MGESGFGDWKVTGWDWESSGEVRSPAWRRALPTELEAFIPKCGGEGRVLEGGGEKGCD